MSSADELADHIRRAEREAAKTQKIFDAGAWRKGEVQELILFVQEKTANDWYLDGLKAAYRIVTGSRWMGVPDDDA